MGTWLWLGSLVVVGLIAWWVRRRGSDVDDYYEREHRDPPTFDAGSYLGGDR